MSEALSVIAIVLVIINNVLYLYNVAIYNDVDFSPEQGSLSSIAFIVALIIIVLAGALVASYFVEEGVFSTPYEKFIAARNSIVFQTVFLGVFLMDKFFTVSRFLYFIPWVIILYISYFGGSIAILYGAKGATLPKERPKKEEPKEVVEGVLGKSPYKTSYLIRGKQGKLVKVVYSRVDLVTRGLGYWLQLNDVPGVARLLRFEGNTFYREYIEGRSLREILLEKGFLSIEETCRVALGIAKVLEKAHARGIVHCDLKPENIIVRDLSKGDVVIIDWEFSAKEGEEYTFLPKTSLYSPLRTDRVSRQLDIYALGVIIDEMLYGRPFTTKAITTETDKAFAELVNKCFEGADIGEILKLLNKNCGKT